jgi:hypothetical protein
MAGRQSLLAGCRYRFGHGCEPYWAAGMARIESSARLGHFLLGVVQAAAVPARPGLPAV